MSIRWLYLATLLILAASFSSCSEIVRKKVKFKKNFERLRKVAIVMLIVCMFFTASGCGKQSSTENGKEGCPPLISNSLMASDCIASSFVGGVSTYSECGNVYIIKASIFEEHDKYAQKMKLIEDIKGNFPKNVNTFIAWGGYCSFICLNRMDNLRWFDVQDTLIMILSPSPDLSKLVTHGHTWKEKSEDYATLDCTFSVLQLSDGFVIGRILPSKMKESWGNIVSMEELKLSLEKLSYEERQLIPIDTLQWEDFKEKLKIN